MNKKERIKELENEIADLKARDKEKSRIIDDLETCIEMYEKVIDLSQRELMNANTTLKAQTKVSELTREELINRDKIINALYAVSLIFMLVITGFDSQRYGWTSMPIGFQVIGFVVMICSGWLIWRTMS